LSTPKSGWIAIEAGVPTYCRGDSAVIVEALDPQAAIAVRRECFLTVRVVSAMARSRPSAAEPGSHTVPRAVVPTEGAIGLRKTGLF